MPRAYTGVNVLDEAVNRMVTLYEEGHRIVVSFSGGKDSIGYLRPYDPSRQAP